MLKSNNFCKFYFAKVNGRRYTWSDAAHAVMDLMDNSVNTWKFEFSFEISLFVGRGVLLDV